MAMHNAEKNVQDTYRRYLFSIIVLLIACSIMQLVTSAITILLYLGGIDQRNLILDCVDSDRANSECQKESRARTAKFTQDFAKIVIYANQCADRVDGDKAIQDCVTQKIQLQAALEKK